MLHRVIINGASGKMGQIACQALKTQAKTYDVVAKLGSQDNLAAMIHQVKPDIVIDLTRADCVFQNTQTIIEHQCRFVIGTSGLTDENITTLKARCEQQKLGGIIVPNFSLAAVLMMQFAQKAAKYMPQAEIIEAHHTQKQDAPSGTAIKTASLIQNNRKTQPESFATHEIYPGARGATCEHTPIHSIRLPGFIAQQQVIFGQLGETLTLTHNTLDRTSFIPGILMACAQAFKIEKLYYGLEHFL